jgi:dihydroorotate dehydrogenase (NAD+) catalytic subunit
LGETGKTLERAFNSGAGAITTKSIGLEPRPGHGNPTIVELPYGLLNAMGLPNPGISDYKQELEQVVKTGKPVIGSIFGKNADEFTKLGTFMQDHGASAVELNLSCPHAAGYGVELGGGRENVKLITEQVNNVVKIPIFVKLTPNTADIIALGKAAVDGGCDALVAINTVKGMAINPELARPVLSNKFGGYSGPGIKPIGLRCVYALAKANLGVPIIGVGGISTGMDAIEYVMAGSAAVQVGTAIYHHGYEVFNKITSTIEEFLTTNNYNSVHEIIGLAVKD